MRSMTRQQLLDNLDTVQKAQRRFVIMVVWAGLIFSCFALVFVKAFRSRIVVVEVGALLLFAAVVADLLRLLRRRAKLGLVCPKCRDVFGVEKFQVVMTTGKCRRCGHKILDD
jgi:DNA-directed RNA polymerase subunit RPC12/RpoP